MINSDVLRIISAKGAGDGVLRRLYYKMQGNAQYTLHEICESQEIMKIFGIDEEVARNIFLAAEASYRLQDELWENDIGMYWLDDAEYPYGIKNLSAGSIPAVLFYKGNYNLIGRKSVGFTGSRKVSDSGIRITDELARQLSQNEITIVSGYANGVDITAHKAALQEDGSTIFVVVEGILRSRVKGEIKELLNDTNHLFISQFPPNITWIASNAMKRNNTIIGLSDLMIMIESGMAGGTFDAGEQSLKNHKPLFVVEYSGNKPTAEGNPYFINRGGVPIRRDKNGKPVLKNVYSVFEKDKQEEHYEQLTLKGVM